MSMVKFLKNYKCKNIQKKTIKSMNSDEIFIRGLKKEGLTEVFVRDLITF
jgi:hypothetical protein